MVSSQKSGVRSQESEVRSQESEVRSQRSGVRGQKVARAYGPTGRCQLGMLEIRVQFPVGPLGNSEFGIRSWELKTPSSLRTPNSELEKRMAAGYRLAGPLR